MLLYLQETQQLSEKLDAKALAGLASLQDEVQQQDSRQVALATQLQADAAATRGQLASLKQWFDANQVSSHILATFLGFVICSSVSVAADHGVLAVAHKG